MSIFSGLSKTFKSITNSSLGRGLLTAAAVYVGGSALGMWEGPEWTQNWFGDAAASNAGNAMGSTASAVADSTNAVPDDVMSLLQPETAAPQPNGLINARTPMQDVTGDMDYSSGSTRNTNLPKNGLINKVNQTASSWLPEGDRAQAALLTVGGSVLANAFKPTPADIYAAQKKAELEYQRDLAALKQPNYNVSGVSLGMRPPGLINSRVA